MSQAIGELMGNITPPRTDKRKAFLHYIFTTALEGGINYWSQTQEYYWQKQNGCSGTSTASGANDGPITPDYVDDIDGFYATIISNDEEDGWGLPQEELDALDFQTTPPRGKDQNHCSIRIDIDTIERGCMRFWEYVMGVRDICGREADKDGFQPTSANPLSETHYWRQFLVQDLTNGDDGDSDSDVCDTIVQLGLFNEVVYG